MQEMFLISYIKRANIWHHIITLQYIKIITIYVLSLLNLNIIYKKNQNIKDFKLLHVLK